MPQPAKAFIPKLMPNNKSLVDHMDHLPATNDPTSPQELRRHYQFVNGSRLLKSTNWSSIILSFNFKKVKATAKQIMLARPTPLTGTKTSGCCCTPNSIARTSMGSRQLSYPCQRSWATLSQSVSSGKPSEGSCSCRVIKWKAITWFSAWSSVQWQHFDLTWEYAIKRQFEASKLCSVSLQ